MDGLATKAIVSIQSIGPMTDCVPNAMRSQRRTLMAKIAITIESDDRMILKIERFLAWLHLNTRWGHSGTVAMDCDGDGSDWVTVVGIDSDKHKDYVDRLSGRSPKTKSVEYINAEP